VSVSTIRRIDASTLPPNVKACGHYTNSVRAVQEAIRRGFDDALLFNAKGDIAEGSGANLFVVRDGTVITNDQSASILMGVTRDSVLTIARDLGLPVEIRPITHQDVTMGDELFFTGTAVEVMPIREVDGKVIGDGTTGPITQQIQKTFYDAVHGRVPKYKSWLSPVGAD
jgi:branched-chain amino acid aminotransferase